MLKMPVRQPPLSYQTCPTSPPGTGLVPVHCNTELEDSAEARVDFMINDHHIVCNHVGCICVGCLSLNSGQKSYVPQNAGNRNGLGACLWVQQGFSFSGSLLEQSYSDWLWIFTFTKGLNYGVCVCVCSVWVCIGIYCMHVCVSICTVYAYVAYTLTYARECKLIYTYISESGYEKVVQVR